MGIQMTEVSQSEFSIYFTLDNYSVIAEFVYCFFVNKGDNDTHCGRWMSKSSDRKDKRKLNWNRRFFGQRKQTKNSWLVVFNIVWRDSCVSEVKNRTK